MALVGLSGGETRQNWIGMDFLMKNIMRVPINSLPIT
jgi:hypothetical protein